MNKNIIKKFKEQLDMNGQCKTEIWQILIKYTNIIKKDDHYRIDAQAEINAVIDNYIPPNKDKVVKYK